MNLIFVKIAALCCAFAVVGCGNSEQQGKDAANALAENYIKNPLARGWKVLSIDPDTQNNVLSVQVLVTSEADVKNIHMLSRMEQFSIAKLACPMMHAGLQEAIGANTRIWVHLRAHNKDIAASVCPQK